MNELTETKENAAIVVVPAVGRNADAREALKAAFGGAGGKRDLDKMLDKIKIPGGGSTIFTVPGVSGDEAHKELVGVILDQQEKRAFWPSSYDSSTGNAMPECSSDDAVIGSDGSLCASCPRSKFDDASGRQPCKAIREIMFLRSGHTVPNIIPLPPSSIEAARRYTTRLASFGLPVHAVVTRIALEKANNKKGVAFARATFTCVGNLTGEQRSELKAYMQIIRPRTVDVMRPVTSSGEAEGEVIET